MKQVTILALYGVLAASFAACTKELPTIQSPAVHSSRAAVPVQFGFSLVGQSMTKGQSAADILEEMTPANAFSLTLTSESGQEYTTSTGSTIYVTPGRYHVTGKSSPDGYASFNADAGFDAVPWLTIDTDIDIVAGTSSYTLPANYVCSAIIWKESEVAVAEFNKTTGQKVPIPYTQKNDLCITFLIGQTEGKDIPVIFTAAYGFKNTSFTLNTYDPALPNYMRQGYFYILSMPGAEMSTTYTFEPVSAWQEGDFLQ